MGDDDNFIEKWNNAEVLILVCVEVSVGVEENGL